VTKVQGVFEPVEPPVEKPETPTMPPSTEDLITIKIEDDIMAVVGADDWEAIAYGNGKYVAVGMYRHIATSTDGTTWTMQTIGSNLWNGIAYGNGKFVAVGLKGTIAVSTDGITWSTSTRTPAYNMKCLLFANGKFVAGDSGKSVSLLTGLTGMHLHYKNRV